MSQNPAFRFLQWENAPRFGITEAVGAALIAGGVGAATAGTVASVAVPALVGAGVGAVGSAVTGGKPLQGALIGGALGGVGGALGAFSGLGGGAASGAADGLTPIGNVGADASGVLAGAAPEAGAAGTAAFTDTAGNLFDAAGNFLGSGSGVAFTNSAGQAFDAAGNVIPNAVGSGGTLSAAAPAASTASTPPISGNQLAQTAAKVVSGSGNNGNNNEKGGIGGTNLALGALAALGSAFAKPKVGTWTTPGPTSVASSPGFNTPLNTNVPGRTAVNPMPGQPSSSWYTYGQNPEPTYFNNNSTAAYGFARGGALEHEFRTDGRSKQVQGPGTGVSDSVPAALSNGEYVLTAADVARIGRPDNPSAPGANDRGARILDRDRGALARAARQPQFEKKGARNSLNESAITRRGRAV